MAAPTARGRFVWHELMTSNPDAAAAFYGKVVGWKTQSWPQDPSYRTWMAGNAGVGGLMALPDEAKLAGSPPHWMTYVGVPDVDASVRQATGLGARTHVAPQDIPGAGRFAVLQDPQGASFAVYTPPSTGGDPTGADAFSWHELATTDNEAAWKFYRTLFGWQHTSSMDMGQQGTYLMFGLGGPQPIGGIYNKPPEMPMPSWLPYIKVPLADDVATAAKRAGGRIIVGPMEVPGGDRVVVFFDAQGAHIAAHSVAAAAPAKKKAAKKKPAKKSAAKKKPGKKKPAKKKARAKPKATARRRR